MHQDKDRASKWLISHHGDAILRLAGLAGFSSWRPLQPETVAPRRLPDGLLEVRYPGEAEPTLVLVEIETYAARDADRQVLDDLHIVALDRDVIPEVVCLVLRPRGRAEVTGAAERVSRRGTTRVAASWPVVRLWELQAEDLLAAGDPGLLPWVPLTRSNESPRDLVRRCRERIEQVPAPSDRERLLVVTGILARLAFTDRTLLDLLGGTELMIDSPLLEGIREEIRLWTIRDLILENLALRFGEVPEDRLRPLRTIGDERRMRALSRLAMTCPTLEAFVEAVNEPEA